MVLGVDTKNPSIAIVNCKLTWPIHLNMLLQSLVCRYFPKQCCVLMGTVTDISMNNTDDDIIWWSSDKIGHVAKTSATPAYAKASTTTGVSVLYNSILAFADVLSFDSKWMIGSISSLLILSTTDCCHRKLSQKNLSKAMLLWSS